MVLVIVIGIAVGLQVAGGSSPHAQPSDREFCFAEWCIKPMSATWSPHLVKVVTRVRSDARAISQRADHPQAWLVDSDSRRTGGPQTTLDRLVAPGESYEATLDFATTSPNTCFGLLVSEGAWPPWLGLGYAPSPFTEKVQWRICNLHTSA